MLVVPGSTIRANCPAIAGLIGGPICGQVFTACVIASIFGCGFTALLGMARVSYSMAETKLFPRQFTTHDAFAPKVPLPPYITGFNFGASPLLASAPMLLPALDFSPMLTHF